MIDEIELTQELRERHELYNDLHAEMNQKCRYKYSVLCADWVEWHENVDFLWHILDMWRDNRIDEIAWIKKMD